MNSDGSELPSRQVDWAAIRARLERAEQAETDPAAQAQREATALRRRADQARAPRRRDEGALGLPIITFRLGEQVFAVGAEAVIEAHVLAHEIEALPGLPSTVRGLANVRSRVLAVFDASPLLRLPTSPAADARRILIVSAEQAEFALLIDEVLDQRAIGAVAARRDVPGLNPQFVQSLTPDGVVLLDLPEIARALAISDPVSGPFPASNS